MSNSLFYTSPSLSSTKITNFKLYNTKLYNSPSFLDENTWINKLIHWNIELIVTIMNQRLYTCQCTIIHVLYNKHQSTLNINQIQTKPKQMKSINQSKQFKQSNKIKRYKKLPPILLLQI